MIDCPRCSGTGWLSDKTPCGECFKGHIPDPDYFKPRLVKHQFDAKHAPSGVKKPSSVFVGSMTDLFGDWVPDKWIDRVFDACEGTFHRFYFLTKNSARYNRLNKLWIPPSNWWFGFSATSQDNYNKRLQDIKDLNNTFVSLEPLLSRIRELDYAVKPKWVIVGAQSQPTVLPEKQWVLNIRDQCRNLGILLFEKNSLAPLDLPGGLVQEWPK